MNREITIGGGNPHACASCKHQRKKCDGSCELAPYFPASRCGEFQHAQKLFGISNIQKIINSVAPDQRQAAAESILMEGNIRYYDPVHGCLGVVCNLKSQIQFYEKQLDALNQQLTFFREREKQQQLENFITTSSAAVAPPLTPSMFQNEFDGSNYQPPTPTDCLPDIGDLKMIERLYNYQSTIEEGADMKPYDMQAMDDIVDPYQTDQAFTCFDAPENPKKREKQALEAGEDMDLWSGKGKKRMGD